MTIKSQGLNNERPLVYTYGCQKVLHNSRAKHPAAVTKCDMERSQSATVMTLTSSGGDTLTRRQAEMVSAQTGRGLYTTSTQKHVSFSLCEKIFVFLVKQEAVMHSVISSQLTAV